MTWLERIRIAIARHPRASRALLVVGILVLESWWLFSDHYRGLATFPYDFSSTYHAVPFYWQGSIRAGSFPEWIPHQAFGYPLALNLQSSLFYPPLWAFPLVGATYTIRAAAIVQVLHVLVGGLGAFAFARARKLTFSAALISGVAFQAFGGFFSNAQHVDIVRGYALTPWLLAALTLGDDGWAARYRAWLVPPVVYLVMTGAYPGQAIACLVFGFGYLVYQLVEARLEGRSVAQVVRPAAVRGGAILLGLGMSAVSVLPGWVLRDEISRVDEVGQMTVTGLGLDHAFTTVFPYDASILSGDVSMRSLFITVPVLFGLFLLRRADLKRHSSIIMLAVTAALMMGGGVVFASVVRLVPPLGYSRFPAADYRAIVALPAVLLGSTALCALFERRDRRWGLLVPVALFLGFAALGAYRFHALDLRSTQLAGIAIVIVVVIALVASTLIPTIPSEVLVACLLPLLLFDAHRMHGSVTEMWHDSVAHVPYKRFAGELVAELQRELRARPARDPARYQTGQGSPDLDGYLRGHYTSDDYAASEHFRVVQAIRASAEITNYLVQAADPRLVPTSSRDASVALALGQHDRTGSASSTHFTANRIEYELSAQADSILLENEPHFEGWRGYLDCDPALEQAPVRELWPLRAWRVPAGSHRFCVAFMTPGLRAAAAVSLVFLGFWMAWLVWAIRRSRLAA